MARVKKTLLDKEKELKQILFDTKKKLAAIHNKQKADIGELAFKHGLHEIDLNVLETQFKKISEESKNKQK